MGRELGLSVENFQQSNFASQSEAYDSCKQLSEQSLDLLGNHSILTRIRHTAGAKAEQTIEQRSEFSAQTNNSPEKIIDIKDVDKIVGWWQKQEYEKLGVQKIKLGADSVAFELSAPYKKTRFFTTLEMDKTFSFKFDPAGKSWTLSDVQGLKVEGETIHKVESNGSKILFWTNRGKREYPKAAGDYIKALFDPLMDSRLRK